MKLTPRISTIASAVLALSLPFTLSKEKVNRPPVDPEPTETPEPTPTPSPEKSVGSIGSQMPVIFEEWWLESSDSFAILSGPSLMEGAEFRTNIIFTWQGQVKFNMEFWSKDGVKLGSKFFDTYVIEECPQGECSGYFQFNNAMHEINPTYYDIYTVKCIPVGGTGRIFFFATSIDNRSGDPTTYSQFRFAKDGSVWSEGGVYSPAR